MKSAIFIRHCMGRDRVTSETPALFFPLPDRNEFYQDVVAITLEQHSETLIYTVGKRVFPSGMDLSTPSKRWMLVYIVEGTLSYEAEELHKGDIALAPASCSRTFHSKNRTVFYWCTTNDPRLIRLIAECGYHGNGLWFGHLEQSPELTEMFEQTIYRFPCQCEHHRIYLMGQFARLFAFLFSSASELRKVNTDPIFNRCLNRIEAMSGNVTVDYLAKHYFVSRRYLYQLFQKYKNMSPTEYILNVRMQEADRYLTGTDYSISRIAELTGYSDYTHFTRAYSKHFHVSPSRRRKEWIDQFGHLDLQSDQPISLLWEE